MTANLAFNPFKRLLLLLLIPIAALGQNIGEEPQRQMPTGSIEGQVVDRDTQAPLPGANILVRGTTMGAMSNAYGRFVIRRLPVGSCVLECRYIGYNTQTLTDIIIRPERTTPVRVALQVSAVTAGEVTVKAGFFPASDDHPLSLTAFSFEEIRRAPGAAGDISRIIQGLPSLAKVNDQANPLIVRGGSPIENAFYIDGIEVPNINHFPTQGASSGPIGMIQVDFIQDARFHAGGFSAAWGDRLSSILDISFREGGREHLEGQLDLSYAGFGGAVEGPLPAGKGSWMAAVRRSYLDLAVRAFDVGSTVAPRYGDYQGKVVWDISPRHRLSLLALWGDDHNNPDREAAVANKMIYYGRQKLLQGTAGLSWRALWGRRGYSQTALFWNHAAYAEDLNDTNSGLSLLRNRSHEEAAALRNFNHLRLSPRLSIAFGAEVRGLRSRYDNRYPAAAAIPVASAAWAVPSCSSAMTSLAAASSPATTASTAAAAAPGTGTAPDGSTSPLRLNTRLTGVKAGFFVQHSVKPATSVTAIFGVRADWFSRSGRSTISPRASLAWEINPLTRLSASAGLFRQTLPTLLLAQQPEKKLDDLRSLHYIAGIERLLSADTRLTIEVYQKKSSHFPIAQDEPALFLVDEIIYSYGFYQLHSDVSSSGQALSRGLEVTVQKKMAKNLYGLASATWFRTLYRGADRIWRDRIYDNRGIVAMEGGYRPGRGWDLSLRWIYAGGAPYTPVDAAASALAHNTVYDTARINTERYPAYHSLNLRADRRFTFASSNLVAYLNVWNGYNRRNVAGYFWNEAERKVDTVFQFGLLPVIGLEYEF